MTMILAHRGLLYGPDWRHENTVASVEECGKLGVKGVEIDVRMLDKEVVCAHGPEMKQQEPGRFTEILKLCKKYNMFLYVDVKETNAGLEAVKLCMKYHIKSDMVVFASRDFFFFSFFFLMDCMSMDLLWMIDQS